ncbi:MAG: hypothetical protein QE271_10670 [Bacteriovoracaceae bacterium]|nr:hypothetical protein [Bacteriovoracaceae bacterium]
MKFLLFVGAIGFFNIHAFAAVNKETIVIVKPLIELKDTVIDFNDGFPPTGGAVVEDKTGGSFQSTFPSKAECISWAKNSVATLKASQKTVFSASCSNTDIAPVYLDAGHFVGLVKYL